MATPDIFRVKLAQRIDRAFRGLTFTIMLSKVVAGSRTAGSLTGGTNNTRTSHSARGFVEDFSAREINGTSIRSGMRRIILFGASISGGVEPSSGDFLTAENQVYIVTNVQRDPAGATFTCVVRPQ